MDEEDGVYGLAFWFGEDVGVGFAVEGCGFIEGPDFFRGEF